MDLTFCPLFSGSSGNSTYVSAGSTRLLVDAGVSGKRIEAELKDIRVNPAELSGILVTHDHRDHVYGVGVLSRRYDLPVYAAERTWEVISGEIGGIAVRNMRIFDPGQGFYVGDFEVVPFRTPHDAADPVGFSIYSGRAKVSIITDVGCIKEDWMEHAAGSDILLIESNHDRGMLEVGPYPYALKRRILSKRGHLSNDDAGGAVAELAARGVRTFILGHLSGENNYPELAYECAASALREAGMAPGCDVGLSVAYRGQRSGLYTVGGTYGEVASWK